MQTIESPYAELQRRAEAERAKAERKYGAQALSPRGDESRDVLDYTINELAGLPRYAEMIEARFPEARARRLATSLRQLAELMSVDLILFRRAMLEDGVALGAPEHGDCR